MDIKNKSLEELKDLCCKIRERILNVVSHNGGHLSSNMGAVELSVAMHYVFDVKKDPFIFDVSHQCYAHKLLTGRWDSFETLRKFGGISGFTKPNESGADYFIAGHSSTSISLAVGAAKAISLKKEDRIPVALIGDGAMSAGIAYEALNELGDRKYPCVIILNDNEMSISKPIGALSKYLSQAMAGSFYQKFKKRVEKFLEYLPDSASYMARRFEEGFKLITPGMFFEELGLEYIGPVDGHNLKALIDTLKVAKEMKKPVIVHAQTIKGKGYERAEGCLESWHGVGPFDLQSGKSPKKSTKLSATKIFESELLSLAKAHDNIVGITAAMPSGTGMDKLIETYPDRFWDVAIAEQHGVTSMAAMAKEGFKPYVAIYSTFLQRAFDQIVHDTAIMNLSVVFAIDRAGIVGEDGETHEGVFDISYLNLIPNLTLCAPRDENSFRELLRYSYSHKGPLAIRYPRGGFGLDDEFGEFKLNSHFLKNRGSNITLLGYGDAVGRANEVMSLLEEKSVSVNLVDLVFIKPLDEEFLKELSKVSKIWYIFSDSVKNGGVGDIISSFLQRSEIYSVRLDSFEIEDEFIPHGEKSIVEIHLGIDAKTVSEKIYNKTKG
ncbi:MAG: 1-deoxy-D-xylulose-5-phosphate synthase [Campylobacter sp.]|nr:1-deoxy-D-xylulose-5-phosphate synthase [Campylobacter sp.]